MNTDRCLIIAEAGVNHNGNLELAYKLCDAAKQVGADVVKFQTYKTEEIITNGVKQAEYQKNNTGVEESQFDMLKKLELSYEQFRQIKKYCDEIGITFASTGDTAEDLDFLTSIGIPFIKIGSGDMGNVSFLRHAGSKGLPIIMSTGMSSLEDIELSLNALRQGGAEDITLLHCTTSYPCQYKDVNLKAMKTIEEKFGLPIGYSDHTLGNTVAVAAVALGACVIEKHFTLDKKMEGPDHLASSSPEEFKFLVDSVRDIEKAMGDGNKIPTEVEKEISDVILKRIVAREEIKKGQILTEDYLFVKRNNCGLMAKDWDLVIGTKAKKDYMKDEGII